MAASRISPLVTLSIAAAFACLAPFACGGELIEAPGPVADDESDDESDEIGNDQGESSESGTDDSDTSTSESTTEDPTTDTDTTTETTDTGNGACEQPHSFLLYAADYAEATGWVLGESTLEPNDVLFIPQDVDEGTVTFDIDIPCEDTWHIWVRAIEQQEYDSFYARVDEEPNPAAIFELDCTMGPMDATYEWKELNYREQGANGCTYVADPWTQEWSAGIHTLELGYRESWAISRVWISNTAQTPP